MCEANVYLVDEKGEKTLLLEAVDKIIPNDDGIFIENIFGERKTVDAKIKEMALVDHKVLLTKL
ncbi:MAG: CooT family nickel-binding protein [Eubacteriaceae bacterium]